MRFKNVFILLAVILCFVVPGSLYLNSNAKFNAEEFETRAVFELTNHKLTEIKRGSSKLAIVSAFATYTNQFFSGKTNALLIHFLTKPMTEKAKADILLNDAEELKRSEYAALTLFLDKQNQIGQVNLTYVIPGATVTRTVAWKPEEIKKYFSDYRFDQDRLRLKSKGSYSESESNEEVLKLSWDLDLNIPVFDHIKR